MKLNKVFAAILALGLLCSTFLGFQRFQVESEYKNYEVDFYYEELEKLAQQEGKTTLEYLRLLKDTGIHNMFIREETLQIMKQSPNYVVDTKMDGYDMIIESPDAKLIQRIYKGYSEVARSDREVILEDENTVRVKGKSYEMITAPVATLGSYGQRSMTTQVWEGSTLETVGLGYDSVAIERAKMNGYGVILAPIYNSDFQDPEKSVQRYFDTVDSYELSPSHVYFLGSKVLGFDAVKTKSEESVERAMTALAKGLEDRDIALAFIESSSQGGYLDSEGMAKLAKQVEYEATGSYLTWDFIQSKYDYKIPYHHNGEEITNIFFRGITTRNIRTIILKPFVADNRFVSDPAAYKNVLDNLASRLRVHHIQPGPLKTMRYLDPSPYYKIFIGAGILAAGLIILDNLFSLSKRLMYILLMLGVLGTAAVYVKIAALASLATKVYALLGAIVMPTLALFVLASILKQKYSEKDSLGLGKSMLASMGAVLVLFAISMGGAAFAIAMLAHSRFLLGLDAFSGVKFAQMIPMLLAPVIYVAYNGYKRGYKTKEIGLKLEDVKKFLGDSMKLWQVALLGTAAMLMLIFMMRSGNTSGEPALAEVLLRNGLEFVFPARPRTKAIFVGIPALMLLLYHAYRKRYEFAAWVLMFVGSIALVNVVNTYSHMKAPIYLSTYRTLAELLIGFLVGIALILLEEIIRKIANQVILKKRG